MEVGRAIDELDELRARKEVDHVSVFALAPIPLLIWLGYRLGDIQPVEVFPKRRDTQGWEFSDSGDDLGFHVQIEGVLAGDAILALDVSDATDIPPALSNLPVVRVRVEHPGLDIVTCRAHVAVFVHFAGGR